MATWQVDFQIVVPPKGLSEAFLNAVAGILSPAPSWSPKLKVFGEADGHRLEVWSEDGELLEPWLRVDLRNPDVELFRRLLQCLRETGCNLQSESGELLAADPDPFFAAIRSSKAFQFVGDPQAYLERLSRE